MSEKINLARRESNVITRKEEDSPNSKIFGKFNKVFVSGMIETELEYDFQFRWEKFYRTTIAITRYSGTVDLIPLVISDMLISQDTLKESLKGKWVEITGQFRSYNKIGKDGLNHLILFLFATSIVIYEDASELEENPNSNLIYLDGYLCKSPIYRKTFLGREISDLLIAVNRPYRKSDYIPCITWGRVARWASGLEVGNRVQLYGRIQSRIYYKKLSPDSDITEPRTAYEISIMQIQIVDN